MEALFFFLFIAVLSAIVYAFIYTFNRLDEKGCKEIDEQLRRLEKNLIKLIRRTKNGNLHNPNKCRG